MKKQPKKSEGGEKSSKLLTGALIGAVLGVAAGVFAASKTGRKLGNVAKKQIKDKSGEFYRFIVPQLKKAKTMTEDEYKVFIARALRSFSKNKKMTKEEIDSLAKEAHNYWKLLKKHF